MSEEEQKQPQAQIPQPESHLPKYVEDMPEESLPQFDEILNDPKGIDYVKEVLHKSRLHQNVMTLDEFKRYEPLFRYSGKEELGTQEFGEIALEYARRICRFDPVYIVNEKNQVLFVLPPVFNRTKTINTVGQTGTDVAQAFVNACNLPDEIANGKREKYGKFYSQLFDLAQDQNEYNRHKEVAAEMAQQVLTTTGNLQKQEKEASEIEDLDPSDLKENDTNTSSAPGKTEALPFTGDDDVEYM